MKALGDAVQGPGDGVGLVAAHDQAADILLKIGQAVRVAQGRQVRGDAVDGFGDEILVLDRLQGHRHTRKRADFAGPLAGAVDHHLAGNVARGGGDTDDPAVLHLDGADRAVFDNASATAPRALGQGLGDVGRVGLAVGWQKGGAGHVTHIHERPQVLSLSRR